MYCLCCCSYFACWVCYFDCSCNVFIQVIFSHTTWIILVWIIWQLISYCLRIIWCYSCCAVFQLNRNINVVFSLESIIVWDITFNYVTIWNSNVCLNGFISLTTQSFRLNHSSTVVAVYIVNFD